MAMFDFDKEFKLGIEAVDKEHVKLVDMLNEVYALLGEGKRDQAYRVFSQTLASYVDEHFTNEEQFMESIGFPYLEQHEKVHANFKDSFQELKPAVESQDDQAFRKALSDTFTWIITHIAKTDRKYADFYASQKSA
jgi:hemerythrin-like metal-binding protein